MRLLRPNNQSPVLTGVTWFLLLVSTANFSLAQDTVSPNTEESTAAKQDQQTLIDELRLAIEEVEAEGGPYDAGLREPLGDLADQLTAIGEHSEALQLYGRLLHISRINEGLYSDSQFPIIEKVINGNLALQDWKALNDSQDYRYFLSQQVYADDQQARLQSLDRHINWKLMNLGFDTVKDKSQHLFELRDLSDQALEIREEGEGQEGFNKLDLARSYYVRAMMHFYFSLAIDTSLETGRELARRKSTTGTFSDSYVPSNLDTDPQIRMERAKGKRLLESLQALFAAEDEKQQLAMSHVYFGDWYLLAGSRSKAEENYRKANDLLVEAGLSQAEVNALFKVPLAIPVTKPTFAIEELRATALISSPDTEDADRVRLANYYAWSRSLPGVKFPLGDLIETDSISQENFVDVDFNIKVKAKEYSTPSPHATSSFRLREGKGNVDNIATLEAQTSDEKTRWEARNDIEMLMFRPKIVDGEAVETKARLRYIFAPDQ